ncbi:uncharacterized protein [Mytilus edulis]|uniref:uncharacterized protein n=1 Tax=Mytilus edulis TaxID=6550 RepID=UPI0039EE10D7
MYIQENQTAIREPERQAMHQSFFPTDKMSNSIHKRRRLNSYPSSKTEVNNIKNRKITVELSEIKFSVLRIKLKMKHTKAQTIESTRSESDKSRGFDTFEQNSLRTVTEIKKGLNDIEMDLDIQSKTKEQLQINLQKQMSIPNLKHETGNLKSKNSFDWLQYLFMLRFVPNQCFQALPVSLNTYFESLSSGSTMSMDESMSNHLLRLSSYSNFPRNVNVFVSALSKAGFYYTGSTDTVRCYACGITHQNWIRGDNPEEIHCRLSPSCTHLQNSRLFGGAGIAENQHMNSSNNRSSVLSESSLTPKKQSLQNGAASNDQNKTLSSTTSEPSSLLNGAASNDQNKTSISTTSEPSSLFNGETSNNIRNQLRSKDFKPTANSSSENTNFEHDINTNGACSESTKANQNGACGCFESSSSRQLTNNDISSLGIDLEKPRYQNYAVLQVRISSFQGWPSYLDQTPRQMAIAGFLFAGYHDYTRCFFCGGGLRNWEAGDDPWVEHARWFPKCTYLRQNKGDAFIKAVQDKHEQMDKSDQITSLQTTETTQNGSNLLSYSNPQQSSSPSYLDTAAARSVLEMGYTQEQVLRVIQQLLPDKPGGTFTALDIMTVLLEKDENQTNGSTGSTSGNSTNASGTSTNTSRISTNTSGTSTNTSGISTNTSGTSTNAVPSNTNTHENGAHEPLVNSLNESNLDDAELLVEENRQLRDQRLCKICLELEASIAFLPCGHLVCCSDCAPAMRKCPICRTYVKGTVKTFLILRRQKRDMCKSSTGFPVAAAGRKASERNTYPIVSSTQIFKRSTSVIVCKDEVDRLKNLQSISNIKSSTLRIHLKLNQQKNSNVGVLQPSLRTELLDKETNKRTSKNRSNTKNVTFQEELNIIKETLDEVETLIDVQSKRNEKIYSKFHSYVKSEEEINVESPKRSKGLYDLLDYLFMLQWIPTQYLNILPVTLNTYFDSLSSGSAISTDESMSNGLLRLHSFNNFPRTVDIFVSNLSKAGFYFTGNDDNVQCYACGITYRNWKRGDIPIEIHRRLSPLCPHIRNCNSVAIDTNEQQHIPSQDARLTNIPTQSVFIPGIHVQQSIGIQQSGCMSEGRNLSPIMQYSSINSSGATGHNQSIGNDDTKYAEPKPSRNAVNLEHIDNKKDTCSEPEVNNTLSHGACGCYESSSSSRISSNATSSFGIDLDNPRYPNYAALQVRISSFQGWPSYLDQTPKQMATAGFLFAGYQDYTRCFFCGGGLRNWEAGDDPWVEHARWFPKCSYLRQNKGDRFIKAVQDKHEQLNKEESKKSDQITSFQTTETTQNGSNLLSHSNPQQSSSPSYLDTAAAMSVLEMGYTQEQVLRVIQQLLREKPDGTYTATDIMSILLENDQPNVDSTNAVRHNSSANDLSLNATSQGNNIPEPLINNLSESNLDDAESLIEENRQLRDQRLCKICLELDASIAFLPCGHLVSCSDCAPALRRCPMCRAFVKGTVKTFLV